MLFQYVRDFGEMVIKFPFELLNMLLARVPMYSCSRISFGSVLHNSGPLEKKLHPPSVLGLKDCNLTIHNPYPISSNILNPKNPDAPPPPPPQYIHYTCGKIISANRITVLSITSLIQIITLQ